MDRVVTYFSQVDAEHVALYLAVVRWAMPVLTAFLVLRCARSLLSFRREPEIWGWLCPDKGKKMPLSHWENVVGRSRRSDVVINLSTVSRNHAVFTRYDDGSWSVSDANSKSGVLVNGEKITIRALQPGDVITIGGMNMTLEPISRKQEIHMAKLRTKASGVSDSLANLLLLSVIQLLCCLGYVLTGTQQTAGNVLMGFGGIFVCQWLLLLFYFSIRRTAYEVETLSFFLCTMGMAAISAVAPQETRKQLISMVLGLAVFLLVGWSLRDLDRAKKFRYLATAAGIGFLVITLIFGKEYYGAKNWIIINGMSIQPSELSKVCFVYAGASTMDRLMRKRNLILFIAYSAVICGLLALMNDFGTALIFFCAFLVIAYMRSGSVGTITLACASLGFAGVVALKIAPHALKRFAAWRHVWEYPLTSGYQQTRALMCIASGGLLGLGAGQGWMKNVFAADSDVVFATLCEEWGLIMASMPVICILVLGIFAVRSAPVERSSFYAIGGCTAVSILLLQAMLNVLGTVDVLPLTGVTFPFLSNGGSSMICAWGLLAFVKAADTRQNASFAVPLLKRRRGSDA